MFQPESTGNFKQTFFELEMVHAGDEFGTALALHQAGPPCLGALEPVDIMPKVFSELTNCHPLRLKFA